MPLIEETASTATACISTAPVFKNCQHHGLRSVGGVKKWWTAREPNLKPVKDSDRVTLLKWAAFLIITFAVSYAVPIDRPVLMAFSTFPLPLPHDNGSTLLPYFIHFVLVNIVIRTMHAGGWWTFSVLPNMFGLLPFADWLYGVDLLNQSVVEQRELHSRSAFKWIPLSAVPTVLFLIGYGCHFVNTRAVSAFEFVGICVSIGIYTGAIGITCGHELCHKSAALERYSGKLLLSAVSYGHFYIEHTLGHHKTVCTDADPATARFGESFWAFLPRVIKGEFTSALRLESERLRRKRLPWWQNEVQYYFLVSALLCAAYVTTFGRWSAPLFLGQSAFAILLFEGVNYLEHYGLERRLGADGEYEAVQPQHSWDSPARVTNMILIKLQRHADHHAHAGKRFQTLQVYSASPQLPSG